MANEFLTAMLQSLNQKAQTLGASKAANITAGNTAIADVLKQKREERLKLLTSKEFTAPKGSNIEDVLSGKVSPTRVESEESKLVDMPVYAKVGDKLIQATDPITNQPLIDKGVKPGTPARIISYDTQQSQQDRRLSQAKTIIDKFNSDQAVKAYQTQLDSIANIKDLTLSDNPISHASLPTLMARGVGREVGMLSEADKAPFGGSRAVNEKLKQAMKYAANGKLTEANKNFILNLTATVEKKVIERHDKLARHRAAQYSKIGGGIYGTENEIYDYLRPSYEGSPKAQPAQDMGNIESLKSKYGLE